MAYAELAGLPPVYGLYASLIPLLVYAVFGPSRVLVMGPDSSTAPLVAAAIIPLALADPSQRVALAGMLALLVGVMSLVVGVARLGFVAALLSKPVRLGYMNGIAVVVVVSQLPKLFGYKAPAEGVFLQIVEFFKGLGAINPVAATLGVSSLVIILALRVLAPKIPGPLVVVVAGTIASAVLQLQQYGVATVGVLPQGLPHPSFPAVGMSADPRTGGRRIRRRHPLADRHQRAVAVVRGALRLRAWTPTRSSRRSASPTSPSGCSRASP